MDGVSRFKKVGSCRNLICRELGGKRRQGFQRFQGWLRPTARLLATGAAPAHLAPAARAVTPEPDMTRQDKTEENLTTPSGRARIDEYYQ